MGNPDVGWLEGRLSRVVWASEDGGYAVVRLKTAKGEVTAVGDLALLADEADIDTFVALEGRWESHAVHGRQFRSTGFLDGLPRTLDGLELYLAQAEIPGVGRKTARQIVRHFGVSTLQVLSDDLDKLLDVPGLGPTRVEAIRTRWESDQEGAALTVRLRGLGLSSRVVRRIREAYGDAAATVVARKPYRLSEEISGVGFRTADAIALQHGIPKDAPERVRAAAEYALERASQEGHSFLTWTQLEQAVQGLGVPTEQLSDAVSSAELDRRLIREQPTGEPTQVYLARLWRYETEIAEQLRGRTEHGVRRGVSDEEIERAERYERVSLSAEQREAVRVALGGGVVVVTGGPGTGKTTLLKVLARAARERGEQWSLASPTGRAARRLEEATGQAASTLHRLLEYRPGEGGFQRDESNPLDADGLIVDEVSMVDLQLMCALLRSIPDPSVSLVLVGDAEQLPSVGPGQVLRDLLQSEVVKQVRLTHVYRQEKESGILSAALAIQAGRVPVSGEHASYDDCFLVERGDPDHALSTLLAVITKRLPALGFDPIHDVQVLTPMKKGTLGTQNLNEAMQRALNPDGKEIKRGNRGFRHGDRVICTRNRYEVEVFNGDTGLVLDASASGLVIDFDGRRVDWPWEELGSLELAYAITVHKSQGSEYGAVVLMLHHSHGLMLRKNLFYTAITRAKRFLCVVGSHRAWQKSVGSASGDERNSGLQRRLLNVG